MMTEQEAREYVAGRHDDDAMDDADMDAVFSALYGREPDRQDRADGVWSLCCAA